MVDPTVASYYRELALQIFVSVFLFLRVEPYRDNPCYSIGWFYLLTYYIVMFVLEPLNILQNPASGSVTYLLSHAGTFDI